MYYLQQLSNSKHYLLEDFARTTRLYIIVTIKPIERPARKKLQFHWLVYMSSSFTRCITRFSTTAKQPSEFNTSFHAARQSVRAMRLVLLSSLPPQAIAATSVSRKNPTMTYGPQFLAFDINDSL
jgi:hypothetical protein